MTKCFVDNNQQLLDFTQEDDCLISFHPLEDVPVSDTCERRRQSLLRKSLGWDSAFFTMEGLLNPEELVKVNKGFKKLNPATPKDAKISTRIAGSFKKMNICSQNKDKVTSRPKLNSSRQTNNNAAVGRSDNGVKIINKTRNAQDSKMSSPCFTSPAVQKTVHHPYESPHSARRSTISVGCNSFKKTNICSQNKDNVTRLPKNSAAVERSDNRVKIENKTKKEQDPKRSASDGLPKLTCFTSPTVKKTVLHSYELSSSKNLSKSIKRKVNPKKMQPVDSPTSVFHFPSSPSSTSPSSFADGEFLSLSRNATMGSGRPKRKIKSSGPRTQSIKMGSFDEVVDLMSQDQSNLSPCVSTGKCLTAGKSLSRKPDARKVGSSCSKSKPDRQISKEILKNGMMSSDQKRQKDDCGSFQAEKNNVHSFKDEVKGQQIHSSFKDDKLQLIDCSKEDDYLLPLPYRDSLENLRLSATFDNVHKDVQSDPRRQSFLRKSLAWDSAFFTSAGLLNPEELLMLNEGVKISNPTTPKDVKGSDIAETENKTRTAQGSKRFCWGVLPKPTCFTSPTIQKIVQHSHESSSKKLSKSVKKEVNPKNMKLVNSPSSVLNFPMSPSSASPASSNDGKSLSSTSVSRQNAKAVLDFQSHDYEERKFIGQNAVKASGLRMPSPRIGFFDMEPGSIQDYFRSQFQSSNLSPCVSAENRKKVVTGPKRDRLKHIGRSPYQEYPLHYSRTALAGKMLSFDAELYD